MKTKDYVKKWKVSLIKETLLIGSLTVLLFLCLYLMLSTETIVKEAFSFTIIGTAILFAWSRWIKNDHELACYRKVSLTFIGLLFVWLACIPFGCSTFIQFVLLILCLTCLVPTMNMPK